jgi:hypothetical protein
MLQRPEVPCEIDLPGVCVGRAARRVPVDGGDNVDELAQAIIDQLADYTRHSPMSIDHANETWDLCFGNGETPTVLVTQTDPETGDQRTARYELTLTRVA